VVSASRYRVRARVFLAPGLVLRRNGCTPFFSPTNDLILLLPQPFYLVLAAALPTVGLVRRTQRYVTTAAASMGGGPNIAWCCSSNTLILPNKIPIVK
jgi:hypothetical protein